MSGNEGGGKGAWAGFGIFAAFMLLAAWGGWAARGKVDACSDRADYGLLDLGKDAAVGTWDGVTGLYHKIVD